DVAFEREGARVAVLFADNATYPRRELCILRDAALLGMAVGPCDQRIWVHEDGPLRFEPGGRAVLLVPWCSGPAIRVPLDGARPAPMEQRVVAFAPDGSPVAATRAIDHPDRADGLWSVADDDGTVIRSGPRPRTWQLPDPDRTLGRCCMPRIGPDGTIAIGDG